MLGCLIALLLSSSLSILLFISGFNIEIKFLACDSLVHFKHFITGALEVRGGVVALGYE